MLRPRVLRVIVAFRVRFLHAGWWIVLYRPHEIRVSDIELVMEELL